MAWFTLAPISRGRHVAAVTSKVNEEGVSLGNRRVIDEMAHENVFDATFSGLPVKKEGDIVGRNLEVMD